MIVAHLYSSDAQHGRAERLLDRLEGDGHEIVLLDVPVQEAISAPLSAHGSRANEFLTVVSTIFIPLTFIVGVYGMNFDPARSPWNMPEIEWRYGYPAVMGAMALIALTMVPYFRRKGWLAPTR